MRRPRAPAQALGQQQFQLFAQPLAPMAQVGTLVRESGLEELFAGDELETRGVDLALAHPISDSPQMCLSSTTHEAGLDSGAAVLAVKRSDLAVDPIPIDLAGQRNQFVLHVDDLVQSRAEHVIRSRSRASAGIVPSDATQKHAPSQ